MNILETKITFFEKDEFDIHPPNNDPIVITIRRDEWEIIKVLVDQGNSIDTMCLRGYD